MDRLDLIVDVLQQMNLKVDRRRLLQGGLFAGLNLTVLRQLASEPVAPVEAAGNTISMWAFPLTNNDGTNLWGPLTKKFAKENPGLRVKVTLLPWTNRREQMLTAFVSKSTPDTAYLNDDMLIPWTQGNMLVPLDHYFSAAELTDITPNILASSTYKGRLMMIPTLVGTVDSLYNKTLLQKIGGDPENPPGTWDELVTVCQMAKKHGYYGLNYTLANLEAFDTLLWGAGGHYLSPDASKSTVNSPEGVAAAEFVVKFFDNKWVASANSSLATGTTLPDYFLQGKSVLSDLVQNAYPQLAETQMKGVPLGVTPILKNKKQYCSGAVGTLGIFTTAKDPNLAARWIQFMERPDNQAFYNTVGGFVPPRLSARKLWKADPLTSAFGATASYTLFDRDTFWYYEQEATLVLPQLQQAILHKKSPKQAMDDAAKAVDQYIAQATGQG